MAWLIEPESTSASVTSVARLDIPVAVSPYGQGKVPEKVLRGALPAQQALQPPPSFAPVRR